MWSMFGKIHQRNYKNIQPIMKEETHKLLEQAHHLVIKVTGIDISKKERQEVLKEVRLIYKQIKEIDLDVWKLIDIDDNHKTINS